MARFAANRSLSGTERGFAANATCARSRRRCLWFRRTVRRIARRGSRQPSHLPKARRRHPAQGILRRKKAACRSCPSSYRIHPRDSAASVLDSAPSIYPELSKPKHRSILTSLPPSGSSAAPTGDSSGTASRGVTATPAVGPRQKAGPSHMQAAFPAAMPCGECSFPVASRQFAWLPRRGGRPSVDTPAISAAAPVSLLRVPGSGRPENRSVS